MDSDGLLVKEREVVRESPREHEANLRIGVIVQSEFTTSLSKPNPFGKALVNMLPFGIWVDLRDEVRIRLDRVYVLFVPPLSTNKRSISQTARLP